jgi:hypothetical protein
MPFTGATPQFNTAEYSSAGGVCKSCKRPITGDYYRINGMLACESCANQVRQQAPQDTHRAFVRGITFGIGGAILGFILFAGFVIITGISLGYISLAVGFLIGKAMKMGSHGIGGRRYQIAAAALTYIAVSMAAVPIAIHYYRDGKTAQARHKAPPPTAAAPSAPATPNAERPADTTIVVPSDPVDNPPLQEPAVRSQMSASQLIGRLVLLGLASPFWELASPLNGILGLAILALGINIAWKLTAGPGLEILGPFRASAVGTLPTSAA